MHNDSTVNSDVQSLMNATQITLGSCTPSEIADQRISLTINDGDDVEDRKSALKVGLIPCIVLTNPSERTIAMYVS